MKLRRDVQDWVLKAEEDFETVRVLIRKRSVPLNDIVCFHAQQCAEKYLKALLIHHRISFPKTHDLIDLLDLARKVAPELELVRADLAYLQPYSVDSRYPGDSATRTESVRAAKLSALIRSSIRDLLPLKGRRA